MSEVAVAVSELSWFTVSGLCYTVDCAASNMAMTAQLLTASWASEKL